MRLHLYSSCDLHVAAELLTVILGKGGGVELGLSQFFPQRAIVLQLHMTH